MITLNASGGSVTFTFSGNSTYLNDGTIEVPVNSLALIIDESDMATFRKAASNDIFVSANVSEFGMTKAELESWYKANMVGSTGGGGGVTSGEVQTMIDESISGKADSSDVYTTGQTSGATEIANALNAKLDATTYTAYTADTTPKVDAAWENGVKAPSLGYDTISGITLSSLPISGGDYNYSSIATDDSLKSDDESVLGVYATGDTHVVSINPTEKINTAHLRVDKKPFNIKMYWNSSYTGKTSHNIAVNCVVNDGTNGYCQWNWDGSQYTPRSDYNNTAVTLSYDSTNQVVTITPSSSSALDYIKYVKCNRYIAPSSALTQDDCRIGLVTIDSNLYKLQEALDNKVDTSAIATSITSGDTNPVAGGAVYDKVHVTSGEGSTTLLTFGSEIIPESGIISAATNYQSGVTKFNIELDLTQWGRWSPTVGFRDSNNNNYAGQIINTDGVITYADRSDTMFVTSMSATTSYTNNVFTIEVTGLSGDAPSGLTMFGLANIEPVVNAYAVEGESVEYWIKDYIDAKFAELLAIIQDNEEVTAQALNELNNAINNN